MAESTTAWFKKGKGRQRRDTRKMGTDDIDKNKKKVKRKNQ